MDNSIEKRVANLKSNKANNELTLSKIVLDVFVRVICCKSDVNDIFAVLLKYRLKTHL